jgi:hypothetical protein
VTSWLVQRGNHRLGPKRWQWWVGENGVLILMGWTWTRRGAYYRLGVLRSQGDFRPIPPRE